MSPAQLGHEEKWWRIIFNDPPIMYYVYVLISARDRKLYIGSTSNLRQRISQHNAGEVTSTKNRRPLHLVYYEAYRYRKDSERREKYLKGGNGRGQLKIQLREEFIASGYRHAARQRQ